MRTDAASARLARTRWHYGYLVLGVCVLVVTGALGFGRFAYALILPSMQQGLGLTYAQMGFLASGNFVGYLTAALACGLLATRFGPRLVMFLGLLLVGGAMLLTGLAPSFGAALAARTLTGIGSAGGNVSAMSLVSPWFARPRRGLASGLLVAGSGIGLLIAGQVVPRLVEAGGAGGWRNSWHVLGLAVVGVAVLAGLVVRNSPRERGLAPLWAGLETPPSSPGHSESASGGLGAVWRLGAIWHLGLVFAAFGFSYIIYATFFAAHLLKADFPASRVGDLWGLVGLLSLGSGVLWGSVSDRVGRREALAVVFAVQGVSFVLFAVGGSPWAYAASAALYGVAGWSVPAIMAAAVGDYVADRHVPAAMGLIVLIFGLGQAVGPSVAGAIADATGTFALAFVLAALVDGLGAASSLLLRRPP